MFSSYEDDGYNDDGYDNNNNNNNNNNRARNNPNHEFDPDEGYFDHEFQPLGRPGQGDLLRPRTFFDDFRGLNAPRTFEMKAED